VRASKGTLSVIPEKNNPLLSILLPTYNRARFLPQALQSIRSQTWTDWELIIVDDGSTDGTRELVPRLTADIAQPVRYIYRQNGGPARARNTGLDAACGAFIAFFDSDDVWLPHHLTSCVNALVANPDVDWVFAATRRIDYRTRDVLVENSFFESPAIARFLKLRTRRNGELHIIDDPRFRECGFRGSGCGGLQASVVRSTVFATLRFEPVAFFEDRIVVIRAIASGVRFGYFRNVNTLVYTHDANVSFANPNASRNRIDAFRLYIQTLESLRSELPRTKRERRAIETRIAHEYFWNLAYPLFRQGNSAEALQIMRRAIRYCPYKVAFIKTYLLSLFKTLLGIAPTADNDSGASQPPAKARS